MDDEQKPDETAEETEIVTDPSTPVTTDPSTLDVRPSTPHETTPEPETPQEPKSEQPPESPVETPSPPPEKPEPKQQAPEPAPKPAEKKKPVASPPAPKPFDISTLDVSKLSDEQLKAAAALWAKKNQQRNSKLGVRVRRKRAEANRREVIRYVNTHGPTSLSSIARALNLRHRQVADYMQELVKTGQVGASGWGHSRRYFKK